MRSVQLFTVRPERHDNNLEINGTLIDYTIRQGCIELNTEEDGSKWLHIFPLHNVAMVRISKC